jgi:hypothetical protein
MNQHLQNSLQNQQVMGNNQFQMRNDQKHMLPAISANLQQNHQIPKHGGFN